MDRTYRYPRGLAVLLAVAVLVTGCGGSHKSGSATRTGGSSSTPSGGNSAAAGSTGSAGSPSAGRSASGGTSAQPSSSSPVGQEGASAPSLSACTTAAAGDVTKAFGGKVVSASTSTTGTGAQLCRFVVANARVAKNLTISLSTHKPVTAADFSSNRATAVKAGASDVDGVGSGAYYSRSTGTLQFLFGNTGGFVQVQAPLAPGTTLSNAEPGVIALAQAVIANS